MSTFKTNLKHGNSGGQTLAGHIPSTSLNATTTTITTNGWMLASGARAYLLLCEVTTFGAGTATFSVQCATDKDGAGAAALTGFGAATVVMTAVGHAILEIPAGCITTAKPYICGYCVTAGGTNVVKAVLVAVDPAYTA
jgi:hypothetical protein